MGVAVGPVLPVLPHPSQAADQCSRQACRAAWNIKFFS